MRILLTNDDGIHADGLAALERIARALTDDVWICAPETEQSGASRALTLTEPLRVRRLDERRFAVKGTPTDCVMLALQHLVEGGAPDLVLSGVNRGANLAEDVSLSGTVAAAIEAMTLGVPAMALSQSVSSYDDDPRAFAAADAQGAAVVRRLLEAGWSDGVILNVNFPFHERATGRVEVTHQGLRDHRTRFSEARTDLRGRDYYWIGYRVRPSDPEEGTDLAAIYAGHVSVTPLDIDLTHTPSMERLAAALAPVREPVR